MTRRRRRPGAGNLGGGAGGWTRAGDDGPGRGAGAGGEPGRIHATASSLVFGPLFLPGAAPGLALFHACVTPGVAFVARPVGGALFGHLGDRVGRKATPVASPLPMGGSTALVAVLPTFAAI